MDIKNFKDFDEWKDKPPNVWYYLVNTKMPYFQDALNSLDMDISDRRYYLENFANDPNIKKIKLINNNGVWRWNHEDSRFSEYEGEFAGELGFTEEEADKYNL